MPRDPVTGVFTRVSNTFSEPVLGDIIDPVDADEYYDDVDDGLNDLPSALTTYTADGTGAQEIPLKTWLDYIPTALSYLSVSAAISAASALSRPLFLPPRTNTCTSLTLPVGMKIYGNGPTMTILQSDAANGVDIITVSGSFVTIQGIQFTATDAGRVSGSTINISSVGNVVIRDCFVGGANQPKAILIGNNTASIEIDGCTISPPLNGVGIQIGNGAGTSGVDLHLTHTKIVSSQVNRAFGNLILENVGDLTISDVQIIGATTNMYMSPAASQSVLFVNASQLWLDSGVTGLSISPTGTGFVRSCSFEGRPWFGNNTSVDINIAATGSATVNGIDFVNPIIINAPFGIAADGVGISNIRVLGGVVASHTTCGMLFNNVNGVTLNDVRIGPDGGLTVNAVGIELSGTTDNVYINDCNVTANTTAYTSSASGTNIIIRNSPGLTETPLTSLRFANAGFIADANGNELIIFTTTASAVNEITFANGGTGVNPKFTASGETNVGIDFQTKGTGVYRFLATASGPTDIRWFEDTDNGTNYISVIAPSSVASDRVLTLPDATDTLVGKATTDTLTNKTLGAVTLSGTVSGGGQQINNVIIGASTPLAGSFTTLTTSALITATFTSSAGSGTTNALVATANRTTSATGTDTFNAFAFNFNDNGSITPASTSAFLVTPTYANSSNTSSFNTGVQVSFQVTANLTSFDCFRAGGTTFSGTLTNYKAFHAGAPGGTQPTNVFAFYADSAAGPSFFSDGTSTAVPVTKTGTSSTVAATEPSVIFNPSGGHTVTLPAASGVNSGKILWLRLIAAQTVSSASSNVIPLAGGAAGTAIFAATAGKWAMLQSNGTNWEIMASN